MSSPPSTSKYGFPALLEALSLTAEKAVSGAGMELIEVIIVDDSSSDQTRPMLIEAEAANPLLELILDFDRNCGKGAAFAAGARRARGDYLLLADVDL